jgi:hypothetical protein
MIRWFIDLVGWLTQPNPPRQGIEVTIKTKPQPETTSTIRSPSQREIR